MTAAPRQRVIATAGHVDHGKSTLVKALTGTDPDRLREEQERQMTIDLGFAFLPLPSGATAAIVDVPGHRDFIHNMLAGLGGIDAVMVVVAADEGIMPQTREHLAILDLLEVHQGLVVITKADLVESEWLDLVQEEVREALRGGSLAEAALLPVSAVTGQGLDELKVALDRLLSQAPPSPDLGRPRLPIDRVFSLKGHGTIVTGTLVGGRLATGEQVVIQPSGTTTRVRSLQTHGEPIAEAQPGSRTAANLVGVDKEQVRRGEVLVTDEWLRPTLLLDVWVRYLDDAARLLEHNASLQFHTGTFEATARVRLLEADVLSPGERQWAQLVLDRPAPVARGDRFILREASPSATVGGGIVVDAHPARRHRRFDPEVAAWLTALRDLPDEPQVAARLRRFGPSSLGALARSLDITASQAGELLDRLVAAATAVQLSSGGADAAFYAAADSWRSLSEAALAVVNRYHAAQPLRPGMPREELRRALRLRQAPFAAAVSRWLADGMLAAEGDRLRRAEWRVELTGQRRQRADAALSRLRGAAGAGMTLGEVQTLVDDELARALFSAGEMVRLPDDVVLSGDTYATAVDAIVEAIREKGGLSVAEVRDLLASNRRATLALLGYLDDQGLTKREGDLRVAGRRFPR